MGKIIFKAKKNSKTGKVELYEKRDNKFIQTVVEEVRLAYKRMDSYSEEELKNLSK